MDRAAEPAVADRAAPDPQRATFAVAGMSCANCAGSVERALRKDPGIVEARVSYAAATVDVLWDPDRTDLAPALERARRRGYELRPLADAAEREGEAREVTELRLRLALTAFFAVNAMLASLLLYLGAFEEAGPRAAWWAASFGGLMATPAVFVGGWPFLRKAVASVRVGRPGMDLLVSLGALSAYGTSAVLLARGSTEVFFDTASMIVLFLLVGRVIERSARSHALDAVRSLLSLAPEVARRVDADGERSVAVAELGIGDRVRVRPGERLAVDGVVLEGRASLDRAVLTGESEPVLVAAGDTVEAGTVSLDGALLVEVTRRLDERAVDRVVQAVQALIAQRAPMQALADRVANVLVGVVLALAALTVALHLAWGAPWTAAILHAVAVVVIACPCALGLATPMAIVVAAGRAAREGIVFRDGEAIERAATVRAVLLDKTGTLTEGRPRVHRVRAADGVSDETVLGVAATAEHGSEHVLGRAIVEAAGALEDPGGVTTAVPGLGVCWDRDGERVLVGRLELLEEHGVRVPPLRGAARTRAHVARNGRWLGAIELTDGLREGSARAVRSLRDEGMTVALATGDAPTPARRVGRAVGLAPTEVYAELRPEEKATRVAEARASGPVAFVGDGVNDGPALAAADLGVAVSGATDVALATAQVTLRGGGVERLPRALELARRTTRVMRQNLGWALAYNAVALPAAVLGFVHPAAAALAMAASSISVVLSSLRLARPAKASARQPAPSATTGLRGSPSGGTGLPTESGR